MKMFLPILKRGKSGGNINFANGDSYLVTYHLIGILIIKIMTLRKVVYIIPVRIDKVHQLSNFNRLQLLTGLTYTPVICTIVFPLPCKLQKYSLKMGLR